MLLEVLYDNPQATMRLYYGSEFALFLVTLTL